MPLLSMRVTVVLLISVIVGIVAGLLALFATPKKSVPAAVLVGGGAAGASLALFNTLIGM